MLQWTIDELAARAKMSTRTIIRAEEQDQAAVALNRKPFRIAIDQPPFARGSWGAIVSRSSWATGPVSAHTTRKSSPARFSGGGITPPASSQAEHPGPRP